MSSAVRDVLGADPPLIASPGTYDQKHVMRLGHVDQCIAYGPGILHFAHQPDEYCRIDHHGGCGEGHGASRDAAARDVAVL